MMYLYSLLFTVIIGTSLFAMDKDKQKSTSYYMRGELSEVSIDKDKGKIDYTYKHTDGSKSKYTEYADKSKTK